MTIRVMRTGVMTTGYDGRVMMAACDARQPRRPGARGDVRAGRWRNRWTSSCGMQPSSAGVVLFRRIAGAMALGLAGFAPEPSRAPGAAARPGRPDWPGPLKGRHRDWWTRTRSTRHPAGIRPYVPGDKRTAERERRRGDSRRRPAPRRVPARTRGRDVAQIRKSGKRSRSTIRRPKRPRSNPFLHPKAGVLPDGMAIDRLIASGAVFGACQVALLVQSKMLAGNAGVSAEDATNEWTAT